MKYSKVWIGSASENFDLQKSIKKTRVMYQPSPDVPYTEPTIRVDGESLLWLINSPTWAALYEG